MSDRWYVSGRLGIDTVFDEPTDPNSALSVSWAEVGTAIRHDSTWEALNLLDARSPAIDQGPNLNWWALNDASKAVRLGAITSRFSSIEDGASAGYLAFHTKPLGSDLREAMRITALGNVGIGTSTPHQSAKLHIDGGDLYVSRNVVVHGRIGVGTDNPGANLHVEGAIQVGPGGTITSPGRLHVAGSELLFLLNKDGVIIGKEWGGSGNLVVEGLLGTAGWPATPRTPGWGGGIHTWDVEAEGSIWTNDLYVDGNLHVRGRKYGCVADRFANATDETLERGDVVVLAQEQPRQYSGGDDDIPVPEVDLAQAAYDARVCGIVSEIYEKQPDLDPAKIERGQIGGMVILGAFSACKVDADIAPIAVGDILTTSPTKGHAQKVLEPDKATGAILGKALRSLDRGRGIIPILVTLQ